MFLVLWLTVLYVREREVHTVRIAAIHHNIFCGAMLEAESSSTRSLKKLVHAKWRVEILAVRTVTT